MRKKKIVWHLQRNAWVHDYRVKCLRVGGSLFRQLSNLLEYYSNNWYFSDLTTAAKSALVKFVLWSCNEILLTDKCCKMEDINVDLM